MQIEMKLNSGKSIQMEFSDTVYKNILGLWINAVFGVLLPIDDKVKLSFEEEKEVFFILLEKLTDENKIVFLDSRIAFDNNIKLKDKVWNKSPYEVIQYIKDVFPRSALDENDDELNLFWYDTCPPIAWVHPKTGELISS